MLPKAPRHTNISSHSPGGRCRTSAGLPVGAGRSPRMTAGRDFPTCDISSCTSYDIPRTSLCTGSAGASSGGKWSCADTGGTWEHSTCRCPEGLEASADMQSCECPDEGGESVAVPRVSVLFPNPQSPFDGLQVGFVNTSSGNLTFRRRDIVTRAQGPVVFARVHDSRIAANADFGPGWRLSLAEELLVDGDAVTYVDDAGARHGFAWDAAGYAASPPTPRHAATTLAFEDVGGVRVATMTDGDTTRMGQYPDTRTICPTGAGDVPTPAAGRLGRHSGRRRHPPRRAHMPPTRTSRPTPTSAPAGFAGRGVAGHGERVIYVDEPGARHALARGATGYAASPHPAPCRHMAHLRGHRRHPRRDDDRRPRPAPSSEPASPGRATWKAPFPPGRGRSVRLRGRPPRAQRHGLPEGEARSLERGP